MTTRLEDELRDVFAAKTAAAPVLRAQLPVVVERAASVRRRRRTIAVACVAAVVLAGLLAAVGVQGVKRSTPPAKSPSPPVVEVVRNGALITSDGREVPLGVDEVVWAMRLPAGVLFMSIDGELRLLREDGTTILVAKYRSQVHPFVDGRSIAVQTDRNQTLFARLTPDGLADQVTRQGGEGTMVLGWLGDVVLLVDTVESGGTPRYGIWNPAHPEKEPQWVAPTEPLLFLGATFEASTTDWTFWALTPSASGDGSRCLAQIDPRQRFALLRQACELAIGWRDEVALSPDARHLAVRRGEHLRILRIDTAFDRPRWTDGCPAAERFIWVAPWTLVSENQSVCRIDPSGELTVEDAPPGAAYVSRVGVD
ncbi:MAG: cell wall synthesis protein CwsA [Micromonosporaceae bacterium]